MDTVKSALPEITYPGFPRTHKFQKTNFYLLELTKFDQEPYIFMVSQDNTPGSLQGIFSIVTRNTRNEVLTFLSHSLHLLAPHSESILSIGSINGKTVWVGENFASAGKE